MEKTIKQKYEPVKKIVKTFPLEQWFDVTKPIPKADADLTEAQMSLYALKDGMDPNCAEAKQEYREMRKAVKEHNEKF